MRCEILQLNQPLLCACDFFAEKAALRNLFFRLLGINASVVARPSRINDLPEPLRVFAPLLPQAVSPRFPPSTTLSRR